MIFKNGFLKFAFKIDKIVNKKFIIWMLNKTFDQGTKPILLIYDTHHSA